MAENGDLVKLDEQFQQYCYSESLALQRKSMDKATAEATSAANWREWCAGMDGLGGLIMLAASFIA